MNVKIIKVGTSKGLRIPSKILKSLGEPDEFKLTMTDYGIFLKPIEKNAREGWKKAFCSSNCCILDRKAVEEKV
ncbi:hypothetical protein CRU92_03980 [Arcobacter sp. FW59]|nr:hypothetical protein CRU92_03980 [Arcobacter sp. FW59]